MMGTLNGYDTANQILYEADHSELRWDLLPTDAADRLDGLWTVQVYGGAVQIVSVTIVDGRAKIMLPDLPGRHMALGEVMVQCLFDTSDDDTLYDFNRS
ncbi:unnamed protein product [Dicrocoelium dendriticum]|nr:unnamed protein product [Dicrocoelium dendriticum]